MGAERLTTPKTLCLHHCAGHVQAHQGRRHAAVKVSTRVGAVASAVAGSGSGDGGGDGGDGGRLLRMTESVQDQPLPTLPLDLRQGQVVKGMLLEKDLATQKLPVLMPLKQT